MRVDCPPTVILGRRCSVQPSADIGTSNKQWADGKNPTADPDACIGNVISDNVITTDVCEKTIRVSSQFGERVEEEILTPIIKLIVRVEK